MASLVGAGFDAPKASAVAGAKAHSECLCASFRFPHLATVGSMRYRSITMVISSRTMLMMAEQHEVSDWLSRLLRRN